MDIFNHANTNKKKVGVAICKLDKDYRAKNITMGKQGHFIIIKRIIHQKNTKYLTIYASI